MALPAANVLGNPATITGDYQAAIEAQRQYLEDLSFTNISGQATANQVPSLEDMNGTLTDEQLGKSAVLSGHVRAGNTQIIDGLASSLTGLEVTSQSEGWFEVGPTGSNADVIWPILDALPNRARVLKIVAYLKHDTPSGYNHVFSLYVKKGETGAGTLITWEGNVAWRVEADNQGSSSENLENWTNIEVPLSSNKRFYIYWSNSGSYDSAHDCKIYYRGFIED